MKVTDVQEKLKSLEGTNSTPLWKKKHRSSDESYGLTPPQIEKAAAPEASDHVLADELYNSNNHDLKYYAVCIDSPATYNLNEMKHRVSGFYLSPYTLRFCEEILSQTEYAVHFTDEMAFSPSYQERALGYTILASVATQRTNLSEEYFKSFVRYICRNLEDEEDTEVRAAMIKAVVNIGKRNKRLFQRTMTAAKKVAPVKAKLNGAPSTASVAELLSAQSKYAGTAR